MEIKLTLEKLIKLRNSIINELKSNQKAIIKLNSTKKENKEFNRELLLKLESIQEKLRQDLIEIKINILIFNMNTSLQQNKVFKLTELKEKLKCYENIIFKEGKFKENKIEVEYVNILSKEIVDKKVEIIKNEIKELELQLSTYNNKEVVEINLINSETFNIASKLI